MSSGLILAVPVLAEEPTPPPRPVSVTSRETVAVDLDASGSQIDTRLYTQLTVRGSGRYRIVDPSSTEGLRNLDGFDTPQIHAGAAVWNMKVDGVAQRRTVADYTKTLPVKVRVTYQLDGHTLTPDQLLGRSGQLRVTYDVSNITGRPTRLTFPDGAGGIAQEAVDVVTPYVGQLHTTLPPEFSRVSAPRGDVSADGRGGSRVLWSLVMFEPIGQSRHQLTYSAYASDIELPETTAEFVPVPPERQPEFRFGQEGFAAEIDSRQRLSDQLSLLHSSVLSLRDSATGVLSGMSQLHEDASGLGTKLDRLRQNADVLATQLDQQLTPDAQMLAATALQTAAEARALTLLLGEPFLTEAQRLATAADQLSLEAQGFAQAASQAGSGAEGIGRGLGSAADGSQRLADRLVRTGGEQRSLVDGVASLSAQGTGPLLGGSRGEALASARDLAIMQELNQRAGESAQPYGPPASSGSDSAAYVYRLAGVSHDVAENSRRAAVAGGLLLVGSLVATLVRHRVVPWPRRRPTPPFRG